MSPQPTLWTRFESGPEGDAAWSAFAEYLHLAVPRVSVLDFAKSWRGRPADPLKWSVEWFWEARVAAYDEWSSQAGLRRMYPVTSPAILAVLRICVVELKKYEQAQKEATGSYGFLSMSECLRMLKEVRAAERDIARLSKEAEEAKASGAAIPDFSKLTLEEARQLDTLLGKAEGR